MSEITDVAPEDVANWGGFQEVADWLAMQSGRNISRQHVYSLWRWRIGRGNGPGNGFPQRHLVRLPDGRVKEWFSKQEICAWAETRGYAKT